MGNGRVRGGVGARRIVLFSYVVAERRDRIFVI